MTDPYLLLTPVLALAVLALARFVGCDLIFKLKDPLDPPADVTATPGFQRVDLTWNYPAGDAISFAVIHGTQAGGPYPNSVQVDPGPMDQHGGSVTGLTNVPNFFRVSGEPGDSDFVIPDSAEVSATPVTPFVESRVLGTPHPNDFNGWVGMAIRVGDKPLTVTHVGRIMQAPSTEEHQVKLVEAAGSGGADLGMVGTIPIGTTSDPDSLLGFAYARLPTPVVLNANTEYYVVSHEFAGADGFFNFADTTVMTTGVAQVTSAVFNFDNSANYVREGMPGNTHGPVDFMYEEPA